MSSIRKASVVFSKDYIPGSFDFIEKLLDKYPEMVLYAFVYQAEGIRLRLRFPTRVVLVQLYDKNIITNEFIETNPQEVVLFNQYTGFTADDLTMVADGIKAFNYDMDLVIMMDFEDFLNYKEYNVLHYTPKKTTFIVRGKEVNYDFI